MSPNASAGTFSRRAFIERMGAGAGALAAGMFFAPPARSQFALTSPVVFGRMFPDLGPANPANDRVRAALRDIGKARGILDAADNLAAGPVALIADPALSLNNPNNTTHTAGTTFMGQFIDHDMTFDTDVAARRPDGARADSVNARTPALRPRLGLRRRARAGRRSSTSRAATGRKLRIESGGLFEDLPRARATARPSSPTRATTRT